MNTLSKILNSILKNLGFKIQFGQVSITATANQVTTKTVTFDEAFDSDPIILLTPYSNAPQAVDVAVGSFNANNFTIRCYSTWTGTYNYLNWLAIQKIGGVLTKIKHFIQSLSRKVVIA